MFLLRNNICFNENCRTVSSGDNIFVINFHYVVFVMTELPVKMSVSSWEEKRLVTLFDRFLVADYIEGELC